MIENELDWDVLSLPGVTDACESAALTVATNEAYREAVEREDLQQEAYIIAATLGKRIRSAVDGGLVTAQGVKVDLRGIEKEIEHDLINMSQTVLRRQQRNTSYEQRYTEVDDAGMEPPQRASVLIRQDVSEYTEELVEALIPAIWDESYCYGMRVENAPDPDMPRGTTNKATGNTLGAHIADIKRAWERADLNLNERRALLLAYGFDFSQKEIAFNQGVTQQAISKRLASGVKKLLDFLNGGVYREITGEMQLAVAA